MIPLYAKITDVTQTEWEWMPNRSEKLNNDTIGYMKKWRKLIPVNGITDKLWINPDGSLSDGNARLIIAREQGWELLPTDLSWLLGLQYFPHSKKLAIRTEVLPLFTNTLAKKNPIEQFTKPTDDYYNMKDCVPGISRITVFENATDYYYAIRR